MRFSTRTFLWSFVPFALLLTGSFWAIEKVVVSTVRGAVRESLRTRQSDAASNQAAAAQRNNRLLKVVAEDAALKAGLQLALAEPGAPEARLTVQDHLHEIADNLGFDILLVSDPSGAPLAGVMRIDDQIASIDTSIDKVHVSPPASGFWTVGAHTYSLTSIPVNSAAQALGVLAVGERLNLASLGAPAVLTRAGKVVESTVPGVSGEELEAALAACGATAECEPHLKSESYLSLPLGSAKPDGEFALYTLQSVDHAAIPAQSALRRVFLASGAGALAAALILGAFSSRSIVKPIGELAAYLRESGKTGVLPEFRFTDSPVHEIQELIESFRRAAAAVRDGRNDLQRAYLESVESLASALDARDRYTAGHSRRVSEFSCAIAQRMKLKPAEIERIRISALLHDIGKIGVSDTVLQKPGKLTTEEYALIQQHPVIGRRILEQVQGFQEYLPVVELHHENWDGSGYPHGLRGEEVPLCARIVHVADVYDALTSERPYRKSMTHEQAIGLIGPLAGVHFDPQIVEVFLGLESVATDIRSIQNLRDALRRERAVMEEPVMESNLT